MRELDAMPHTPSLSQLQHPAFAVVNGELVAYDDVKVHISAEALTRALSVFEGMKGYWDLDSQEFAIRSPRQHYDRLRRSATVLHIPVDFSYDEFRDSCLDLARALLTVDRDMWFRTTMYVVEGHWGEGTRADLVVTGFHQTKDPIPPMSLTVSSWRRSGDSQLPYRVKASANYVVARQARIEALRRGFDDAVLLNDAGRVAEATGSCVVALRDGVVCTPPAYEGALESITLDVVERICHRDGVSFERRPMDRTELLMSEEAAIVGTISELTPVSRVDTVELRVDGVLSSLRDRYLNAMRRLQPLPDLEFELVDVGELKQAGPTA
jgi:branched-chain amino acid aminotransferase